VFQSKVHSHEQLSALIQIHHLSRVKVWASQKVLQVDVSLRLGLFKHDHGVRLPQQRSGSSQLSELNQLKNDL